MPGHLIHVGFPKAGSTALQAWFSAHPQLRHSVNALGGYYGAEDLARQAAASEESIRWAVTSSERLVVPSGSDDVAGWVEAPIADRRRRACHRLRELFGDATILVVTRGFAGIIASSYSQYLRGGGTIPAEQLYTGSLRAADNHPADQFDYDATIRLYHEVFGPESVVVLPYELLRDDPETFLGRLEARLGLDPSPHPVPWLNESLTAAELYWYPRFSRCMAAASRPLGTAGAAAFELYRRRIGGPKLGRVIAGLAGVGPKRTVRVEAQLPPELLGACRGRAALLAADPVYAPYAEDYLNAGPA